jgi:putative DNA primase/helicase
VTGADDVRDAIDSAIVLAFPRAASAAAAGEESSQMRGSCDTAPAAGEGGERNNGGHRQDGPDDDRLNQRYAFFPLTDLGNAERFVGRHGEKLRYCNALGWLAWDGRRWKRDGAEESVKLAEHRTVRSIQDEAKAIRRAENLDYMVKKTKTEIIFYSDKLAAWGRASEGAQKLAAISKRAAAMMAIGIEQLDADPMRITVLNGTLHVAKRDGDAPYVQLRPHDPEDYITRLAPVTYDPDARCPLYDRFMDEIHPPDADAEGVPIAPLKRSMQRFLNDWFGYSLTGDTSEQKMIFLYGKGRNGKGVLVNTVSHVAGDYADSIGIESFLDSGRARAGGQATPDLASLPGVRMLGTSEPKKGATLDEAFVKLFTGGDRIKARHLNKDFFAFVPQAKLTMQCNYRPKISGADEGIWGRIKLVPCLVFIPPERRDPKLFDKLKLESSGVLNRLLDGLCRWLDDGLVFPESVQAATAEYRADSDPLARFFEVCVAQHPTSRVQASDMHVLFCAWAKANGETLWTIKGLGSAMRDKGIPSQKSDVIYWTGVKLLKAPDDFIDHEGKVRHQDTRAARKAENWGPDDDPPDPPEMGGL